MAFTSNNLRVCAESGLDFGRTFADPNDYVNFSEVIDLGQNRQIVEGHPCYFKLTFPESFVAGSGAPCLWPGISFCDTETFKTGFVPVTNVVTTTMFGGAYFTAYAAGVNLPAGLLATAMQNGKTLYLPLPVLTFGAAGLDLNLTESTLNDRTRFMALSFWQPRIGVGAYFSAGKITATLENDLGVNTHYPNAI